MLADAAGDFLSVHHCVSRSVRDSALLFSLTERNDAEAPLPPLGFVAGPASRRLRIAFSTQTQLGDAPDADVAAATQAAAQLCAELGHEVVEAAPGVDGEAFVEHFLTQWASGPAQLVEQLRTAGREADVALLEPWTLGLAEEFARKPLGSLSAALEYSAGVEREVDAFFTRYDAWLTPVLASAAPPLGQLAPDVPYDTLRERCIRYVGYTPIHNVAGTPAMSVPLAWNAAGLPIGAQWAARRGGEATLFALAYELEVARPWAARRPGLTG
jgi:amidase